MRNTQKPHVNERSAKTNDYEVARVNAHAYCYCLNHVGQRPQVNGQWAAGDRNLNCKLVHMIATSLIRHMLCLLSAFESSSDHSVCGQAGSKICSVNKMCS